MTSDRSIEEPCEVTSLTHGFEAERRGRPLRLGSIEHAIDPLFLAILRDEEFVADYTVYIHVLEED